MNSEKIVQENIDQKIDYLTRTYLETQTAPPIIKTELDILRKYLNIIPTEQLKLITQMISVQLKPLDLVTKKIKEQTIKTQQTQEEEQKSRIMYSIMRGYRGTIRQELAKRTPQNLPDKIKLLISAATDHKVAADRVTNIGFVNFRFYQRKNASDMYDAALTAIEQNLFNLESITDKKTYFSNEESIYNNRAFFSIIRDYFYKRKNPPPTINETQIRELIQQTTLRIIKSTKYMHEHTKNTKTKKESKSLKKHYEEQAKRMLR